MDYGKVLSDSFTIFWTHRSLWLFGLIAALFGHSDYRFTVNYSQGIRLPLGTEPSFNPFEGTILERIAENPLPYLVAGVSLGVSWWLIATFFGWLAQGALIGMVDEIDRTGSTSLRRGWERGRQQAVPLFFIALILGLPLLLLGGVALLALWPLFQEIITNASPDPTYLLPTFFRVLVWLFPLLCIAIFLSWLLSLLNLIAARSCVLEALGPLESIRRGWSILSRNLGYILLNSFILEMIGGVFGVVVAAPALLLWLPAASALLSNTWSPGAVLALVGLGGILTSFNATLWTQLYKACQLKESRQFPTRQ